MLAEFFARGIGSVTLFTDFYMSAKEGKQELVNMHGLIWAFFEFLPFMHACSEILFVFY